MHDAATTKVKTDPNSSVKVGNFFYNKKVEIYKTEFKSL